MSRSIRRIILSSIAAIVTLPTVITTPAQAADNCQCTTYIANKFELPKNYPHAGDWNDGYLQRNGFVQVGPEVGAVAVMERSFPGADPNFGHVGIIETLNNGRITMRGANQSVGTNYFPENNCANVRVTGFGANVNGDSRISFWKRGNAQPTPNQAIPSVALMVSKATGRALDGGAANGGGLYLNASVVSSNSYEQWRIQPVSRNEYMLINVRSGRALDAGGANGTQVYPNPNVDTNNGYQRFILQKVGDSYVIISIVTGRALDSGGANGTLPYMHPHPAGENNYHLWRFQ
jgi:Ricin-type beta-trefoil lectin domain-like/CHAP domain